MKKSLILLVVLLAVGALAFAEDVKPTWTVSGSAYTMLGYDLNVNAGGITNSQSFDFNFAYFPTQTFSKGSDEKLYGMIEVKDVHFGLIGATWDAKGTAPNTDDYYSTFADDVKNSAGTITAKVVYDPFYVLVSKGLDDVRFNYATNVDGYSDVNYYGLSTLYANAGTIALGYSSKIVSARVTVISNGGYANVPATTQVDKKDPSAFFTSGVGHTDPVTIRTPNLANDWGFGLWVTANPIEMIAVDAKAIFNTVQTWLGFGGKVTVTPFELLSVSVGADAYSSGSNFYIDLAPALTVNLGKDTLTASMYYTTHPVVQTDTEMDVNVKFVEADGDDGYVPGLGASVSFGLANVAPAATYNMGWTLDVTANYVIGAWKPYAEFKMSPNTPVTDQMMKVNAGVVFSGIPNTAITLDYIATDLTSVEAGTYNDKGIISLKTKISY